MHFDFLSLFTNLLILLLNSLFLSISIHVLTYKYFDKFHIQKDSNTYIFYLCKYIRVSRFIWWISQNEIFNLDCTIPKSFWWGDFKNAKIFNFWQFFPLPIAVLNLLHNGSEITIIKLISLPLWSKFKMATGKGKNCQKFKILTFLKSAHQNLSENVQCRLNFSNVENGTP